MRLRNSYRTDTGALRLAGIDTPLVSTRDQLEQLALHTDVVTIRTGERLCRVGQYPRQFLVVVDGYVAATDRSGSTRIAGPGTRIGGIELLDGVPHDETIVTRSDCRLVVIFGPALTLAVHTSRRTNGGSPGPIDAWLRDAARHAEPTLPAAVAC